MIKFLFIFFLSLLVVSQVEAQLAKVKGKVYAFKDLPLNKVQVSAKKAKTETLTNTEGEFIIQCENRDKLEFSGEGFLKESKKLEEGENEIAIKLIFKGGAKSQEEAVGSSHVSEEQLLHSIETYPEYNFNYYNYPDVYTLIDKIYQDNYNINVRENAVYARKDSRSNFSQTPAIYVVNGRVAFEIKDILPRDIKTIKVLTDATDEYGPSAVGGVVKITTTNQ